MDPAKPQMSLCLAAGLLALALAACGARPPLAAQGSDASAQDAGYMAAPRVDTVRASPGGGVVLSGAAPAGGKVRLATPAGEAMFAAADRQGRWAIPLPAAAEARIFGLSVTVGARAAQAEGYVLVTPAGKAAVLRAGASARRIDQTPAPGLRAIDFDRGGGFLVSASVPPGATVILRVDGRQAPLARAGANGRYEASLGSPTPVRPGAHEVQVSGDGFNDQVEVRTTPAAPLAQGPLRSQFTPAGLQVDWMTPGGGVQSTILVH